MRGWWRLLLCGLVGLLAACSFSVPPQVTPTAAPTRTATTTLTPTLTATIIPPSATPSATTTASLTNTATATATLTPSATLTPTATLTATATITTSATATQTLMPTVTPSPTLTFTTTPSLTPTLTATATATLPPTVTPLPILPTDTPTVTPSATVTASPTATWTIPPSLTPLPSLTSTFTPAAQVNLQPTPNLPPPVTFPPPPTLNVTPTFITVEAPTPAAQVTPLISFITPEVAASPTPKLFPTVELRVTLSLVIHAEPTVIYLPPNPEVRAFALSSSGGVSTAGFSLLNGTALFARNPLDPNQYVTTDTSGNLYLTGINGQGAYRPDMSPFSQFIAQSREENTAYVSAVAWSPDGRSVAFIVAGRKVANDGVWYFQPGLFPPIQQMVDCPSAGFPGCMIVSNPVNPDNWESRSLTWSPGSDSLLVSAYSANEGRLLLFILTPSGNERVRDVRPNPIRFEYGAWARDNGRVLVSGRGEDGHVMLAWVNRDGSFAEMVYDAEANGLWMGFANPARDGSIYALGAPGGRDGAHEALRIYNQFGVALTPPIGDGFPSRAEWSPDGAAVFVEANGRQYLAQVNGNVREITAQVAGTRAISWVDGILPISDGFTGAGSLANLPSGVVEGSAYFPGQQLQVAVLQLNVRNGPGTSNAFAREALNLGEFVAILAGPVENEGYTWWQVQTADGVVGWVAGVIDGVPTLRS